MAANGDTPSEAIVENVALIFGVTGLVGKELAKKLIATPRWKVYGVARNSDILPIQNPKYQSISCNLLDPLQCDKKLSALDDVTHIFWVTWASQFPLDSQACCDQNKAMMSNALNAILPIARAVKHVSLQTGTKHYVSLRDFSIRNGISYYTEESPRVDEGYNFYYSLEDLLNSNLLRKVAWSVHRPGLILGSSQRTVFNVMGCLGVYGTICRYLNLPFVFGGLKECWEEIYLDGSDARLVAEQHIWSSTNDSISSTNGQAFNAINGTSFTWKEIWPALAAKFGLNTPNNVYFSSSFSFYHFMADKGAVWEEIISKEGLRRNKMEELANWGFLDTLFRFPMKLLVDRQKADRLGFTTTYSTVDSMLHWVDCMREEKLIP